MHVPLKLSLVPSSHRPLTFNGTQQHTSSPAADTITPLGHMYCLTQVITELATAHGNRPAVRAKSSSSGSRGSGLGGEGIMPAQRLYEEYVR